MESDHAATFLIAELSALNRERAVENAGRSASVLVLVYIVLGFVSAAGSLAAAVWEHPPSRSDTLHDGQYGNSPHASLGLGASSNLPPDKKVER
jgi:hypothetical protein